MPFFNVDEIQRYAAEGRTIANKRGRGRVEVLYCGHCKAERESIRLWHGQVHFDFIGIRICLTCGYSPGKNIGVPSKKMKEAVRRADDYECVYCGATKNLATDHIIPHSHGGQRTFDNLVTACQTCNTKRRNGTSALLRFGRFRRQS